MQETLSSGIVHEYTEQQKRTLSWDLLVKAGRKGSYQGLPEITLITDDEGNVSYNRDAYEGKKAAIAGRRAKNKVAKASRKANRV